MPYRVNIENYVAYRLKGQSAKFLSFDMLIGTLDGALVQNMCPVPHFNPKLWALKVGQRVPLLSRPKNFNKILLFTRYQNISRDSCILNCVMQLNK